MALQRPTTASTAGPSQRADTSVVLEPSKIASRNPYIEQQALDDSREWILFPTTLSSSATVTEQSSTARTARTATHSRLSDLESVNARTPSTADLAGRRPSFGGTEESVDETDHDLDSLDDGLHAFQAHEPSRLLSSHFHLSSSILPRHDGLGGFAALREAAGLRPGESVKSLGSRKRSFDSHRQGDAHNVAAPMRATAHRIEEGPLKEERRQRIEQWRSDHSRTICREIEKETRRQSAEVSRQSGSGVRHASRAKSGVWDQRRPSLTAHVEIEGAETTGEEDRTLLERIFNRVVHDILGIDDQTLALIFGESLTSDETPVSDGLPVAKAARLEDQVGDYGVSEDPDASKPWQKATKRFARELGFLMEHISHHPSEDTIYESGERAITEPTSSRTHPPRPSNARRPLSQSPPDQITASNSIAFTPTLQRTAPVDLDERAAADAATFASLWGIESSFDSPETAAAIRDSELKRKYWEASPDLKTIFSRFVYTRLNSSPALEDENSGTKLAAPSYPHSSPPRNLPATAPSAASLRRAALISQYHPLTSDHHNPHHYRSHSYQHRHSSHSHRRTSQHKPWRQSESSVCGSESLRHGMGSSRATTSLSTSRNYWDIGGGWAEV